MYTPITILFIVAIFTFAIWRKTASMRKPIKGKGYHLLYPLLVPVLFGPLLFIGKAAQLGTPISIAMLVGVIALGIVFSIPLVLTTNYERKEDGKIYLKKDKSFIFVIIGLFLLRFGLRSYLADIDPFTLSKLFFIMASVYLVIWRVSCFIKFRKLCVNKEPLLD